MAHARSSTTTAPARTIPSGSHSGASESCSPMFSANRNTTGNTPASSGASHHVRGAVSVTVLNGSLSRGRHDPSGTTVTATTASTPGMTRTSIL